MDLPDELVALLRIPALCSVATVMPNGSPQLTQTWVDTDGKHVVARSNVVAAADVDPFADWEARPDVSWIGRRERVAPAHLGLPHLAL